MSEDPHNDDSAATERRAPQGKVDPGVPPAGGAHPANAGAAGAPSGGGDQPAVKLSEADITAIAKAVVKEEKAAGTSNGLGDIPANLEWEPLFQPASLGLLFIIVPVIAGLGILLLTQLHSRDTFTGLPYRDQLSLIFLGLGVAIFGVAIPTLLGEAARLTKVRVATQVPEGHSIFDQSSTFTTLDAGQDGVTAGPSVHIMPTETIDAVSAMFKGLTAGRAMAATGFLTVLTSAVLAYPLGATDSGPSTGTGGGPSSSTGGTTATPLPETPASTAPTP